MTLPPYHADHLALAGWHAKRWHAPLWMTEGEYLTALALYYETPGHHRGSMFDLFRLHGLDEQRIESMKSFSGAYRRLITELPHTFRRIMPGEEIAIGGRTWQVLLGYGHAPEHVSLYCAALGITLCVERQAWAEAARDPDVVRRRVDLFRFEPLVKLDALAVPSPRDAGALFGEACSEANLASLKLLGALHARTADHLVALDGRIHGLAARAGLLYWRASCQSSISRMDKGYHT